MSEEKIYSYDIIADKGTGRVRSILPSASVRNIKKHFGGSMNNKPNEYEYESSNKWADWGIYNQQPTKMRQKLASVPIAGVTQEHKIAMLYGNGICYHKTSDLAEGNTIRRAYDLRVERFMRTNRITRWYLAQCADYATYLQCFNELVPSKSGRKITNIYHKQAEYCRLSLMHETRKRIEYLYYSTHFKDNPQPLEEDAVKLPNFQWDIEEAFMSRVRQRKANFAMHSFFPTIGMIYYPTPFNIALFQKNGWLDASANVPKIINAMQNNQVSIKYQINVPESYFIMRNEDWMSYTPDQKKKEQDDLEKYIQEVLTGVENSYNSILTVFQDDPSFGPEGTGKIEIKAIEDKTKKDDWVPSSNASDAQIVWGLGYHPSLIGLSYQSGGIGAGSGSDQRESFNTAVGLNTMHQHIILEPLNWISQVNGWGVTFFIDHTHHTTTNNQEDGLNPSTTTTQQEAA